jgi:hypothetical protein
MGQQQLLLIILGVIIVGIAIAVGLQLFQSGSVGANQDAIVNDLMNIVAHAQQYYVRPESMGGGGGSFDGYVRPERLRETGNGTYEVTATGQEITVVGTSVIHTGTITVTYNRALEGDPDQNPYNWLSDGDFAGAFAQ